jgi:hypothetical protein
MGNVLKETLEREQFLKDQGFNVVSIWEHEYDARLRREPEFRQFCKETVVLEPMNPRAAFYGGRTNATKLYHKVSGGEEIHYKDVCR